MKYKLFPLLLVGLITSCNQGSLITDNFFSFDTYIDVKLFEGNNKNKEELHDIFLNYDHFSDNYHAVAGINNISSINLTNEPLEIDARLYTMLVSAFKYNDYHAYNFNPLCGSLAKAWKEALNNNTILDEATITSELNKMNNSTLEFLGDNKVKRVGEAELDLGGIAKGYTLDEARSYLAFNNINHYLINAGTSSVLLGEKNNSDGYFKVGIDEKILPHTYMKLKNTFISTSSISEQGVKIGDITYSHIINPFTGSAINKQETVIVLSSSGYKGDALSTSLVNNTIEEIKAIEEVEDIKCIVINNKNITYKNEGITLYNY